jgi:protein phosphatase
MLLCAQCGFENPTSNKFCQECGGSLTQNTCPECSSLVAFDSLNCPVCGAIAGVIWRAILTGDQKLSDEMTRSIGQQAEEYLDLQGRYKLLEALPTTPAAELQVRVLDCQPLQLSLLESLVRQEAEEVGSGLTVNALAVPAIAQPYLELGTQFQQAIPAIHDAWYQDGQTIILLEDRLGLPSLMQLWQDSSLANPQLQLLQWMYEMAELWEALEPWNCQQSLLEMDNLRVDEDHVLSFQHLYFNPTEVKLSLIDLAKVWHRLFDESQRTLFGNIFLLLNEVDSGKLTTAEAVRSRIESLAQEIQPDLADPDETDLPDTTPQPTTASAIATHLELSDLPMPDDDDEHESDSEPTVVLPMQLFSLDDVGRTDVGRQRQHNEDYFGIETQVIRLESPSGRTVHVRNLYILCDGMGGQADGEVASTMAVETLRQYFQETWQNQPFTHNSGSLPSAELLTEAIQRANKAIYDMNQQNARSGIGRMGTTLVMALICDTELAIVNVGDSRLYRYTRKRGLEQLTVDHEVGQREIQRGVEPEIAYARPDAYQLTQALGPRDENFVKPDVHYWELNEDALLLLCSDGLSDNDLLENHCKTHLEPLLSSQANLEQGVNKLIELANQYNGHDNITAIAIRAKVRPNLAHLR